MGGGVSLCMYECDHLSDRLITAAQPGQVCAGPAGEPPCARHKRVLRCGAESLVRG